MNPIRLRLPKEAKLEKVSDSGRTGFLEQARVQCACVAGVRLRVSEGYLLKAAPVKASRGEGAVS